MPSRSFLAVASASDVPHFRLAILTCLLAAACGAGGPGEGEELASAHEPALVWKASGTLSTARTSHTATLLPSGKVLVAGGRSNPVWVVTATAEIYDPFTRTWTATASMGTARSGHTATPLPSGKVLVAGGGLATAEVYDPATGSWSATGSMATSRYSHTATLLQSGMVLVTGGNNDGLASAELYDPATGNWSATGSMTSARTLHTATLLASGKVLVAGGYRFPVPLGSAELYDPATGTWTATPSMSTNRKAASATLLLSGKVLLAGGDAGVSYLQATAELYDPASNTWAATGSMAAARAYHSANLLRSGRVLVVLAGAAEVYDPSGTWTSVAAPATSRSSNSMTLLPSGKLLAAGGIDGLNNALATSDVYGPPTGPATADLDGDGRTDILWRNVSSGAVYAWLATGTTFQPAYVTAQGADWQIAASGDFNGDGRADLLWRSASTGAVYVWQASGGVGAPTFQPAYLTTQAADWQIAGTGDFDGNGKTDILWRSASTGAVYAWLATGTATTFQPVYVTTQPADWVIVGTGDLNGDGKADLLWRSTATGAVYAWLAAGGTGTATFLPSYLTTQAADWEIAGMGDFDGDGKTDILWRSASTGAVYAWLATGTGTTFQPVFVTTQRPDWVIVGIGDYDGDWRSDILWRNASTGEVYAWYATGAPGTARFQASHLTTQPADWQVDVGSLSAPPQPPGAASSTVTLRSASVPADGSTVARAAVTVRDAGGRPRSGQAVQLSYTGTAAISPALATTDLLGRATFELAAAAATTGVVVATVQPGTSQVVLSSQPALAFFTPSSQLGYVAMGDSFQSGLGAPAYDPNTRIEGANECLRSQGNAYPHQLAAAVPVPLQVDHVACAGAVTANIWQAIQPNVEPQYDETSQITHLDERTSLVTIGIGGNDLKFSRILKDCITKVVQCSATYATQLADAQQALWGHPGGGPSRLEVLLQEIATRAPNARVLVLGYPRFFPATWAPSCYTISRDEQLWINNAISALNVATRQAAESVGVEYVDTFEAFDGGEACAGAPITFLNDLVKDPFLLTFPPVPTSLEKQFDESFHPTADGHSRLAQILAGALASSLTAATAGSGSGSVTCNGGPCGLVPYGTQVTVAATPAAGSVLASIRGSGSATICNASPCVITVRSPATVTATFTLDP